MEDENNWMGKIRFAPGAVSSFGNLFHFHHDKEELMKVQTLPFLALFSAALAGQVASAHDSTPPPVPAAAAAPAAAPTPADKFAGARALIADKKWTAALDELQRVNDKGSADWNNLMGYTLRKSKTPDLAASEKYYDEALRIDPHHRNALEYSGELYLMRGELDKAQARLATLSSECSSNCEQYVELKSAIARFQAAGNKFVSTTW